MWHAALQQELFKTAFDNSSIIIMHAVFMIANELRDCTEYLDFFFFYLNVGAHLLTAHIFILYG